VTFDEFVAKTKHEIEGIIEHVAFNPKTHFLMLDGDDEGNHQTLVIDNIALNLDLIRKATWERKVLPLIEERKFKRLALIVAGPFWDSETHEADGLGVQVTVADAEQTEEWIAPLTLKAGELAVGEWDGPDLDATIPDFDLLEGALR
jgi:hypothetical protein